MRPGIRVVRGPDWIHGNEDGGLGFLGTVIKMYPDNQVLVRWDIGTETVCRAGKDDAHDLRIYDTAQIGVIFRSVTCDGCGMNGLQGIRWKCLVCDDVDLCVSCYMANEKDTSHPYVRYLTEHSLVVRNPPRRRFRAVQLYGIFPGAEVMKIATGKESTEKEIGVVTELVTMEPDGYKGAVKVEWKEETENGDTKQEVHTYRLGVEGKVELKLVKPSPEKTMVFLDHLPELDLTMPVDIEYNVGDRVRIDLNLETFRPLMTGHGGWVERLEQVLGEEGRILAILDQDRRLVRVMFDNIGAHFVIYMNTMTKMDKISAGDVVKVIEDAEKMKRLQIGHGGWQDTTRSILGEVGIVLRIDNSRDALVRVQDQTFVLNPNCLVWLEKGEVKESQHDESSIQAMVPKAARRLKLAAGVTVGVGLRVVRGPNWSPDFGDQDGGEGHLGSVVEICGSKEGSLYPKQCVVVQWDHGERNVYRAGYEKAHDLRVYDSAGIAMKHEKACVECKVEKILGMLWQCSQCPDVFLCSECYFADKHDIQHQFIRFYSTDLNNGCKMPRRDVSKKLVVQGIFEKSKVERGPDWRWQNQDGGEKKKGEVIALVNFSPDTDRDAAEVTWENGHTNVYRLGYRGRHDVKCVKPSAGGFYYRDHLPLLKIDADLANTGAQQQQVNGTATGTAEAGAGYQDSDTRFKEGDKVKIEIQFDVLKAIEESRGAWDQQMAECIGKEGRVIVSKGADITVDFDSAGKWTFHESVLNKIKEFIPGQTVRVLDKVDKVRTLQSGDWNDLMVEVIGCQGKVEEIDEDGDVRVSFTAAGRSWVFNPECLIIEDGSLTSAPQKSEVPVRTQFQPKNDNQKLQDLFEAIFINDLESVNRIARNDPQLMLMDLNNRYAIHLACHEGRIEVVKALFQHSSTEVLIELCDPEKNTPLLSAVKGEQLEMIKFLVDQRANKDAADQSDRTAVHMAVTSNNINLLLLLLHLGFDINKKDMLNQSAIFDAIVSDNDDFVKIVLEWPQVDVAYEDSIGFTPFCVACRRGNLFAVQHILKLVPGELNKPKRDGYTGLHMAALNNNLDVVQFLLQQNGIDVNAETKNEKRTSLHLASMEGYLEIVKLLLNHGANKLAKDAAGKTVLHLCLEISPEKLKETDMTVDSYVKVAEELLVAGVPYDVKDTAGKLPIEYLKGDMKTAYMAMFQQLSEEQKLNEKQTINERPKQDKDVTPTNTEAQGPRDRTNSDPLAPKEPSGQPRGLERVQMSQSLRQQNPADGFPKIEKLKDEPLVDKQLEDKVQRNGAPEPAEKQSKDLEICESCEEEPIRYTIQPCEHQLCADCIPKKRVKKKTCAVCGEIAVEFVAVA